MKFLVLDKSQFGSWLSELSKDFEVFAPSTTVKGFTDWQRLESGQVPDLRIGVPKSPIKSFFLPQPEVLFEFSTRATDDNAFRLAEPVCTRQPRLLVGVRPCDARSVSLNSMPYEEDPYFNANRDQCWIVGCLCNQCTSTCFCTLTGGSPRDTQGMDVAMVELEEVLALAPVSERGQGLMKNGPFREPDKQEESQIEQFMKGQPEGMEQGQDPADRLKKKDLMVLYNLPMWQGLAEPCINCGACTFLCPTCYCFDIQDESLRGKGRRIRYWDSCMFPLFTQHASGHNPRGDKVKRVRNRFMHKLKYFPDRFGPISCVGCGRCVRECPVNIDIRQVLREFLAI